MSRPLRIDFPGAWHHVMNRGLEKRPIFRSVQDRKSFLQILEETSKTYSIEVHALSLMGNHYHLLVHTPKGGLSRAVRHLNGVYTQDFNRRWSRDGPLFRGRYKSLLVDSEGYLLELVRYIHLNPVEAGLCENPLDHEWTSHRFYLRSKDCPNWFRTEEILDRFQSRREMHHFVCQGVPASFRELVLKERVVLGAEAFKEWVYRNWKGKKRKKGIANKDLLLKLPVKPIQILRLVGDAYHVPVSTLRCGQAFQENEGRRVAIYLLRRLHGMPQHEIARWVGAKTEVPIAKAYERFRKELVKNRQLRRKTNEIAHAVMSHVRP